MGRILRTDSNRQKFAEINHESIQIRLPNHQIA